MLAPRYTAPLRRARCVAMAVLAFGPLTGCGDTAPGACGEGTDPVVVTGLSGVLDGSQLAVEIVTLIPETCEETGERVWMTFQDPGAMVTLGEEPTGLLMRDRIQAGDNTIFFRDHNVGVRLEYPGGVIGPAVHMVWFSMGAELAVVDCAAGPLECAAQE